MQYLIIIKGFQKEFDLQTDAAAFVKELMQADFYYINADETKKPKSERIPTVFVKDQVRKVDDFHVATILLSQAAEVLTKHNIVPTVQLKTLA